MKEEAKGQAKGKAIDHLDILNAFHDDPSPLIDYCVHLAEKGMEKERDFLYSLEEKNGVSHPTNPMGSALADLSLNYISGNISIGLVLARKFKVEDERLSGYLDRIEKEMKESGVLPQWA